MPNKLSSVDSIFFHLESHDTPMHVAGLQIFSLPKDADEDFVLQVLAGRTAVSRPFFNVTVSNVPGPVKPLYLNGARMEAFYPVSIPAHGQAVNITCTSYNGSLNFGFAGCRDALPHLQRLAVYTGEALLELEKALDIEPVIVKPMSPDRRPARAA